MCVASSFTIKPINLAGKITQLFFRSVTNICYCKLVDNVTPMHRRGVFKGSKTIFSIKYGNSGSFFFEIISKLFVKFIFNFDISILLCTRIYTK